MPVFCLDDRLLHGRHALRARARSSCSSPWRTSTARCGERGERPGGPRAGRRSASCRRWRASWAPRGALQRRRRAVRAPGATAGWREALAPGVSCDAHPGACAVDDAAAVRRSRRAVHGVHAVSPRVAAGGRGARCFRRRARCRALPSGLRVGRLPSLRDLGLAQEVERAGARRRARDARRGSPQFLRGAVDGYADGPRRRSDATGISRCRRTCTSAACLRGSSRRGCTAATGRRGLPPSALLARLLRSTCWPTSRQTRVREFQDRYRGTLRWSRAPAAIRGVARRPHGLPARRRRRCASCAARAGCTTAPGWSSARS